jgi:hypothetical protein
VLTTSMFCNISSFCKPLSTRILWISIIMVMNDLHVQIYKKYVKNENFSYNYAYF